MKFHRCNLSLNRDHKRNHSNFRRNEIRWPDQEIFSSNLKRRIERKGSDQAPNQQEKLKTRSQGPTEKDGSS